MALAPPQQLYHSRAEVSPTSTSPEARPVSPRPHLSLSTPGAFVLPTDSTPDTPIQIPSFLQDILDAHPAPSTPASAITNPYTSSAALYTLPQAPPPPEDPLIPPENFSVVSSGVYRCGFPKRRNFKFMETLRLKTVLTLVLEDYPDTNLKWCEERDVQFMVGSLSTRVLQETDNSNSVYRGTRYAEPCASDRIGLTERNHSIISQKTSFVLLSLLFSINGTTQF
jgi:hypothetical protein